MKRVHMVISGRVQGVFFRDTTRRVATKLGLKGFVRNVDTGDVEVVAEGPEEQLKELIRFCRKGPEYAEVTNIKIDYEEPKDDFKFFDMKY